MHVVYKCCCCEVKSPDLEQAMLEATKQLTLHHWSHPINAQSCSSSFYLCCVLCGIFSFCHTHHLQDLASDVAVVAQAVHPKSDDALHSTAFTTMQTPNKSVAVKNSNGPHHLFVPGGISKDGCNQAMYCNFIFDLLSSGSMLEKLYVVICGHCVSIFSKL